ncbi:MAG: hypothetical protein PHV06_08935 [bacterium]|nr:hypothetical protein [bacterium]
MKNDKTFNISTYLDQILNGNNEEIESAKRIIKKRYFFKTKKLTKGKESEIKKIIERMDSFDAIKNIENKIAFIKILKFIYNFTVTDYYSEFSNFLLKLIQDNNEKIRKKAVNSYADLMITLSILVLNNPKEFVNYAAVLFEFCRSVDKIYVLLNKYKKPEYNSCNNLKDLPESVYKSLQKLLNNIFSSIILKAIYEGYKEQNPIKKPVKDIKNTTEDKIWDLYYDAMDYLNEDDIEQAKTLLNKALKIDNDFVGAHVGLVEAYRMEGKIKKMNENIELGYQKTLKVLKPLPKTLSWGNIDNRQYFRAVCFMADYYQYQGQKKEAEELYKLLLRWDSGDHLGVRYYLAGLYAGMLPEKIDKMFDEGNRKQDRSKLEKLLDDQNKKHKFFKY